VNWQITHKAGQAFDVVDYLRDGFQLYSAPLVREHDGASIFLDEAVRGSLDE